MIKKILGMLFSIGILTSCIAEEQDQTLPIKQAEKAVKPVEEKQPPSEVKSAKEIKEGAEIFNELIAPLHEEIDTSYLNEDKHNVQERLGSPDETGWFEGGEFLRYGVFTFFLNPNTNEVESIAVETNKTAFDQQNAEEMLGTPDNRFWNEMDNLWSEIYEFEDGKITLEKDSVEANQVSYIWFENRK
ncbi:hypothetical protein [Alteribacillus bidgolensis]|uniref:Lipoprotein n=1 Tax=Alteribacillus bidgolensis TaxID=930129 RepID=A0A1G8G0W9_9BACI|nr:hypothetical protein [Alteribacillus bidgolensis]SDH87866.1 hypothetical protein SAMN05216352_103168 [Alteribacillus bidgolensis]